MTYYCKHCLAPRREDICPGCGAKPLWEILPEDPCFVTEMGSPWSAVLEDVLHQRGIPYLAQPVWGAGVCAALGSKFERLRFAVPYDRLAEAEGLAGALFAQGEAE